MLYLERNSLGLSHFMINTDDIFDIAHLNKMGNEIIFKKLLVQEDLTW